MRSLGAACHPAIRPIAALLVAVLFSACGGGGGGNSGGGTPPPTPTPPPTASIQFTPVGGPGASTVFLARGAATTTNTLFLEVRANLMPGLYGVTFDLSYPAALLDFVTFTPGDFFAGGAGTPSIQVSESPDGNLIVGATLLGDQPGIAGSGVILTLEMPAVTGGTGDFSFSTQDAFDRDGRSLFGVSWLAGSVQVTR